MRYLQMLCLVILAIAVFGAKAEAKASPNYWTACTQHLDQGDWVIVSCHRYAMPKEHRVRFGFDVRIKKVSSTTRIVIRFPRFVPPQVVSDCFGAGVARWNDAVYYASRATSVPPGDIAAIMTVESRGDPSVVSGAGAIGLMQLLPSTAAAMGVNPWDPAQNVLGGARYLAYLFAHYAYGSFFTAAEMYNAGPGNPAAGYSYAEIVLGVAIRCS